MTWRFLPSLGCVTATLLKELQQILTGKQQPYAFTAVYLRDGRKETVARKSKVTSP
jgi:hypothetical protein